MTKLIVFDKDGTLVEPISGGKFVRHPKDQKLRPGVAEKLEQLRSEGWTMAIASNQGGCSVFEVLDEAIRPGMQVDLGDLWVNVQEVEKTKRKINLLTNIGQCSVSGLYKARYKSIEAATEEMEFALKLTGIDAAFFCPDMMGEKLHFTRQDGAGGDATNDFTAKWQRLYRKPCPGMLYAIGTWSGVGDTMTSIMVGDRPEDQQAAQAAGFHFYWADDFFEVKNV